MNTYYEAKDEMRISDIVRKSKGSDLKAAQLAQTMASRITKADKALRRANAAEDANLHFLAKIFFVRYGQLTGVVR